MSTLLDRLVGYDSDQEKLPIHQFVDAMALATSGFPEAPTQLEIVTVFDLTAAEKSDAITLANHVAGGARTWEDVQRVLRVAERYPAAVPKSRVVAMLGL